MKKMKKMVAMLLAFAMVMAMSATAFAAEKADLSGHQFTAYQIFKADSITADKELGNLAWGDGITSEGQAALLTKYGATDAQDLASKLTEANAETFAKDALPYVVEAKGTVIGSETKLPIGYYIVKDTTADGEKVYNVAVLKVSDADAVVEIDSKVEVPKVEKNILEKNEQDEDVKVKTNNGSIGDVVRYEIKSTVPESTDKYNYYKFIISDTLSDGLTFGDDIEVYAGETKLTETTDYVVRKGADAAPKTFEVALTDAKAHSGETIYVRYTATINEHAVIGTEGNPNEVDLTYSNKPDYTYDGKPFPDDKPDSKEPTGTTPKDKTWTYVTKIKVVKVDGDHNPLTGAEFEITGTKVNIVGITKGEYVVDNENGTFWKLTDGTYTTDDPSTEGMDQTKYESTETKYSYQNKTEYIETKENVEAKAFVDKDGYLTFEGLGAGKYTITETTTPDGYNTAEPVEVEIKWTAPTDLTAENPTCTWSYTNTTGIDDAGVAYVEVVNQKGSTLPETGGMGTKIFYVLGTVLVLGAGVLLITKRRMSAR